MTRAQFIATIATIPFIGKLFKKPRITHTVVSATAPFNYYPIIIERKIEQVTYGDRYEVFCSDNLTTFNNSDGTFMKNVIEDGPITDEELQKYFKASYHAGTAN